MIQSQCAFPENVWAGSSQGLSECKWWSSNSSCSTISLRGNERHGLGQEDGVLIEDPQGLIYHLTSVSLSPLHLLRAPSLPFLSVCLSSSPAEHSVISHSPVGAGSKSAQLDHRHQSQPALRMGHLWAHREAFPLHSKWETNVAGRKQRGTVGAQTGCGGEKVAAVMREKKIGRE